MRAVSFVKRIHWELPGTVFRHGLDIGDVDNDGDNELVVGTAEGELYIFKGHELWQKITGLGLITSIAIGDIFNYGRNALVAICGDGWVHIFYSPRPVNRSSIVNTTATAQNISKELLSNSQKPTTDNTEQSEGTGESTELSGGKMECVHVQRIPTNTKIVLVADVDKDGANEMILGLTDRVVRSYRWSSNADFGTGKLVGLNKWECANQIGTVTLQHTTDGIPTLLVAQPGGTFMRIKCNPDDCRIGDDSCDVNSETAASCVDYQTLGISRMRSQNISTEIIGDLETGNGKFTTPSDYGTTRQYERILDKEDYSQTGTKKSKPSYLELAIPRLHLDVEKNQSGASSKTVDVDQVDGNFIGGNVILGEFDGRVEKKSVLPSYKDFLHNNDNEAKDKYDGLRVEFPETKAQSGDKKISSKPYALATLDGTIMLVKDEVILWSMQVDHQIFALCRLDVTGDGADEIVACSWDGQTYILDQEQNSVRFQFEEPVRAFCTGKYSVTPGNATSCLVYNTFNSKIYLYYDVSLPSMVINSLNLKDELNEEDAKILEMILGNVKDSERQRKMQQLTEWLLYGNQQQ